MNSGSLSFKSNYKMAGDTWITCPITWSYNQKFLLQTYYHTRMANKPWMSMMHQTLAKYPVMHALVRQTDMAKDPRIPRIIWHSRNLPYSYNC